MSIQKPITARRIIELDLLRGFFIIVIVLDHAQFWPSPWQYMTGQGRLWVSAAEGFFLISGLLIGYLRAFKAARAPLKTLSIHLWKRAAMLYIWGVGITFLVVALSMLLPGDGSLLPKLPEATQVTFLPVYFWNVISTSYASDWIYFLRLYAIMLALTPLVLWLLRRGLWWLVIVLSVGCYALSLLVPIDEGAMQWQVLFFGATLLGWKLEAILAWLRARPRLRKSIIAGLITTTLATMALSYFMVHGWGYIESPATSISREAYISIRANVDPLFSNNPLVPLRIALAFIWFGGLLALFHVARQLLTRYTGWLLLPFGKASLTAYCLQAIVLCFVVTLVPNTNNSWLNGFIGAAIIVALWLLMKLRIVQRLLPR